MRLPLPVTYRVSPLTWVLMLVDIVSPFTYLRLPSSFSFSLAAGECSGLSSTEHRDPVGIMRAVGVSTIGTSLGRANPFAPTPATSLSSAAPVTLPPLRASSPPDAPASLTSAFVFSLVLDLANRLVFSQRYTWISSPKGGIVGKKRHERTRQGGARGSILL